VLVCHCSHVAAYVIAHMLRPVSRYMSANTYQYSGRVTNALSDGMEVTSVGRYVLPAAQASTLARSGRLRASCVGRAVTPTLLLEHLRVLLAAQASTPTVRCKHMSLLASCVGLGIIRPRSEQLRAKIVGRALTPTLLLEHLHASRVGRASTLMSQQPSVPVAAQASTLARSEQRMNLFVRYVVQASIALKVPSKSFLHAFKAHLLHQITLSART
jgi:hypothetical protein